MQKLTMFGAAAMSAALAIAGCSEDKPKAGDSTGDGDSKTVATPDGETPGASRPTAQPPAKEQIPPPPDVAAAPADAKKTDSGLSYKVLSSGDGKGETPNEWDRVKVHYTGWTTDGNMFDSSVQRGRPATFQLKAVIAGWTEGLGLMKQGDKFRFWIPEELAYKGRKGAPAGMLVFDVELLEIDEGPKPLPAPPDVAAAPSDAKVTKSGLAYKVLTKGKGKQDVTDRDTVQVHYTGWTTDGKMFDSSVQKKRPATFGVTQVIAGWTEGLQLMKQGDKFRLWIPEKLAYEGKPGRPAGMLVFDVELLEVKKAPKPIRAPKDVAAPPKSAKTTDSGLAYKVVKSGKTGGDKPTAASTVEVHYTGWTTDGKMFDSSVARGKPTQFPLGRVIKGWTEGLQLMSVGDTYRFWIPEGLAYGGRRGKPAGMLVFDVQLLSIKASGTPAKPALRVDPKLKPRSK